MYVLSLTVYACEFLSYALWGNLQQAKLGTNSLAASWDIFHYVYGIKPFAADQGEWG